MSLFQCASWEGSGLLHTSDTAVPPSLCSCAGHLGHSWAGRPEGVLQPSLGLSHQGSARSLLYARVEAWLYPQCFLSWVFLFHFFLFFSTMEVSNELFLQLNKRL